MLTLYARLLALRRAHPALHAGSIEDVQSDGNVLRYVRSSQEESTRFQVLLNLGNEPATVPSGAGSVVLTTLLDGEGGRVESDVTLESGEGVVIALD